MYIWTVKTRRSNSPHYDDLDRNEFTIAAETAEDAIRKALRQSRQYSGYKRVWRVTSLERGGWIVS